MTPTHTTSALLAAPPLGAPAAPAPTLQLTLIRAGDEPRTASTDDVDDVDDVLGRAVRRYGWAM